MSIWFKQTNKSLNKILMWNWTFLKKTTCICSDKMCFSEAFTIMDIDKKLPFFYPYIVSGISYISNTQSIIHRIWPWLEKKTCSHIVNILFSNKFHHVEGGITFYTQRKIANKTWACVATIYNGQMRMSQNILIFV